MVLCPDEADPRQRPLRFSLAFGDYSAYPQGDAEPVREIDVPYLTARVKELEGLLSDMAQDGGIKVGAEAERGAILEAYIAHCTDTTTWKDWIR